MDDIESNLSKMNPEYNGILFKLTLNKVPMRFGLVWFMVFNATFNKFQLCRGGQFYGWRKPAYVEKTTNLPQVTDELIT
jgi:hypothetical protein